MTRKFVPIAALVLFALTSSLSIGTAEAHFSGGFGGGHFGGGHWSGGYGYGGGAHWGGGHWGGHWSGYRPGWGYWGYGVLQPYCYTTIYGNVVCY